MKRLIIRAAGIVLFALSATGVFSQGPEVSKITASLSVGNSSQLAELFLNNIDLSVDGSDDIYSKAQATQILRNFFTQNVAVKFSIEHEGTSRSGDVYRIGTLVTKNGNYRITYYLKNEGGKYMIKELRVEKAAGF